MKKVKVKTIKIENFRGVKSLEFSFSERSKIQGKNGSGKSTIYNAYLWCLFAKDAEGKSMDVQPLTIDNDIVHKVNTSVEITLDVDGVESVIKRVQKENWTVPRGTNEEVFNGNVQERYYNDVPCSVKEFAEKLNAICNVEDWYMLSSITAFMNIKQEDRRKKLTAIAGDIDESVLMLEYPNVAKELSSGKTLEELLRQTRNSYKKAKIDLDEIPSRIDQQEKLRVLDVDFIKVENDNLEIEKEIALIDSKLASKVDVIGEEMKRLLTEKNELLKQTVDIESSLRKERLRKEEVFESQTKKANFAKVQAEENMKLAVERKKNSEKEVEIIGKEIAKLKEEWMVENERVYLSDFATECPMCGTPFEPSKIKEMREVSIKKFNSDKLAKLGAIEERVVEIKAKRKALKEEIERNEILIDTYEKEIAKKDEELKSIQLSVDKIPTVECALASSIEMPKIKEKLNAVECKIKELSNVSVDTEKNALIERKNALMAELKSNITLLQGKVVNERIDSLTKELNEQSRTLSQSVANLDKIVFEIQMYKKRKIGMVEQNVSSFFDMVSWKLYEQNISNDGEKEICQALIDGKPYEQQNTAAKINAGIDIINGFSRALSVSLPLFIDNKESVTTLITSDSQVITLEVVADMDLCITNN